MKRGTQNFKTLLQYLHCEANLFLVILNSITYFKLIPQMETANECVYILKTCLSFVWVAGSEDVCHVPGDVCVGVFFLCVCLLQQLQCLAHWL